MRRLSFDFADPSRWRRRRAAAGAGPGGNAAAAPQTPAAARAATPRPTIRRAACSTLTDREFFIGGRVSSIDGDPARYQRYQDVRDGLLFSGFRYAFAQPDGAYTFKARANNVGWRDQEYFANYNRAGKLSVTGGYQQIPQFYSVDTMTPYTGSGGTLRARRRGAARRPRTAAGLSAYVPIAPQFDLRERRDIGRVDVVATPTPKLDVTASFTTQKHGGELPWGASFGFSNDVEVPLPYDSRTNDFTIGTEWTNTKNMLRVAYSGSWFDNLAPTLVWDSPLRLDDASGAPGRGRMSLWPSNSAQTISFGGYTKLAHKTQVTGFFSYGLWSNDEPLQPFTINSALATIALPRANADAEAHVFSTNLNLTSHPTTDWRFGARFRNYTYANHMPATSITQYVAYDSSVSTTPTGGPDLYAHDRTTFDADATWDKLKPLALTVGYTHNGNGYDARTFKSSGEDVFRVSADAVGTSWATFRVQYEVGSRTGSGLDEQALTDIGEHPEMRHYDLADRTRNRFTRAGRHRPVGRLDVQRLRRTPARRLQQHRLRAAEVERATPSRSPPTTTCRTAWARAPPTTSSGIPDCSNRTRGIRRPRSSTIPCATGRPTRPRRSTISPSTRRRPASAATPRCGSRTISATRTAITSTRFRSAARLRRPISCRRCSTSCSSCTSTRATGSRRTSRRTFSYLYEPLKHL